MTWDVIWVRMVALVDVSRACGLRTPVDRDARDCAEGLVCMTLDRREDVRGRSCTAVHVVHSVGADEHGVWRDRVRQGA